MELANLAQRASSIDKYRVETCCVIGKSHTIVKSHTSGVGKRSYPAGCIKIFAALGLNLYISSSLPALPSN